MNEASVHLELWIEPNSEPISGWVTSSDGERQTFGGWVELTAAIETARRADYQYVGEASGHRS